MNPTLAAWRTNPIIGLLSSIRFGVAVLLLILVYACIASALPQVRGALEMTEMQIFRHWVFTSLIVVFTISLILATITRIRLSWVNAGVLTVHTGLLLLVGGSLLYFGTKTEGDTILFSPRIQLVSTAGGNQRVIAEVLAESGQAWGNFMPAFGGAVQLAVHEVNARQDGAITSAIVTAVAGGRTQDLTLNDGMEIELVPNALLARLVTDVPASTFYDNETTALYVRRTDETTRHILPIEGLPFFRERYPEDGGVLFDTAGRAVRSKRTTPAVQLAGLTLPTGLFEHWRLPIKVRDEALPFDISVDAYLPYVARMDNRPVEGGGAPNPAIELSLSVGGTVIDEALFALQPARSMMPRGIPVDFRWIEREEELASLFAPLAASHELQIELKDPPLSKTVPIVPGQTIKLEGTSYELTVRDVQASWPLMTPGFEGAASPMASVDVKCAEKSYNRTVIQRYPGLSQDIDEQGVRHRTGPYDENLVLRYRTSADGWVTIAAGPGIEPHLAVFAPDGRVDVRPLRLGAPENVVLLNTPLDLTIRSLVHSAATEATPVIEPLERRRPNIAPRGVSVVRVTLSPRDPQAGPPVTRWIPFSQYPHVDTRPVHVTVAGTEFEVIYSRVEHPLGVTLIPRKLSAKLFPGRRTAESWRSDFLIRTSDATAPVPAAVYTNQTCTAGNWTLFQSGAAGDHWSWTILGVGNRRGIWTMLLGCCLVTLGSLYAFYVKPVLIRRRRAAVAASIESANPVDSAEPNSLEPAVMNASTGALRRGSIVTALLGALLFAGGAARAAEEPFAPSTAAAALDRQIDWSRARLIAVQDDNRYKTLDSFARESMMEMYGKEHLPGLSPMASLLEWLFNREAYADSPVIRIKDKGVRIHLSAHMNDAERQRIQQTGYMTPRELASPVVQQRIAELEPMAPMVTAMRRVRNAEAIAMFLDRMLRIVPTPVGDEADLWHTVEELQANLPPDLRAQLGIRSGGAEGGTVPGVTQAHAVSVMAKWAGLWKGWRSAEPDKVQSSLNELAAALPALAANGVYPAQTQRSAEATYYAWGKFTWGFGIYVLGMLFAVPAVVTRWRTPWVVSLVLLVLAMAVHATGIGLRWFILGRIPVANMFEAIVGSAWLGIAVGLLVELRYRTRFALVGAHATGFLALLLAGYVVPGGGTITAILGILDDVMLRIHTVLIIASYALIFLASVIAVIYLFGYYFHRAAARSAEFGAICAVIGVAVWLTSGWVFRPMMAMAGDFVKSPKAGLAFAIAAVATAGILALVARPGASTRVIAGLTGLLVACITFAIGNHGFANGMAWVMLGVGAAWALGNTIGIALRNRAAWGTGGLTPALATAGLGGNGRRARELLHARTAAANAVALRKPLLAGALPGDAPAPTMPPWLQQADWCHLIILNMVFVMLFVGTILGAVWADYSWGRPWGWDPKEVFALNTWIIYAILIHVRFFVKNKGLWTAWLSVAGCLMMAFNWCFVNFYIVGLHSYA